MEGLMESLEKYGPSQNRYELTKLLQEVEAIEPLVILEIGMHLGGSMMIWYERLDPALLIGIDLDKPKLDLNLENILTIQGDSHSYAVLNQIKKRLVDDEIDFLFIDGDHTAKGVAKDFEMYGALVRKGGIIGFHDICVDPALYPDGDVDVATFWKQLKGLLRSSAKYKDWDYKEFWDEGRGTGTGIVYVGTQ